MNEKRMLFYWEYSQKPLNIQTTVQKSRLVVAFVPRYNRLPSVNESISITDGVAFTNRREGVMKVLEFQGHLNSDQTLTVPPAVARQIQGEESLRVVLLVPDETENQGWADLTTKQFLSGYSEGDAIYDQLSAG